MRILVDAHFRRLIWLEFMRTSLMVLVLGVLLGGCGESAPEEIDLQGKTEEQGSSQHYTWNGDTDTYKTNGGIVSLTTTPSYGPGMDCSGIVYRKKYIITARHCLTGLGHGAKKSLSDLTIKLGGKGTTSKDHNEVARIWYPGDPSPDLAILQLTSAYTIDGKEFDNGTVLSTSTPYKLWQSGESKLPPPNTSISCYGYGADTKKQIEPAFGTLRRVQLFVDFTNKFSDYQSEWNKDQSAQKISPVKPFTIDESCEAEERTVGWACNWMKNPGVPSEKYPFQQKQQISSGDSGGPCFRTSTDWQSSGGEVTERELVGINQYSLGAAKLIDYMNFSGSTFSTNVAYYRNWIESVTMEAGFSFEKSSPVPKSKGVWWFPDFNGDNMLDYVKVSDNQVAVGLNTGGNTFFPPAIVNFPIPITVPDKLLVGYVNNDKFPDMVYVSGDYVTSFFTDINSSSISVQAQLPSPLPKVGQGSWTGNDPIDLLSVTSVDYDLVRVSGSEIVVVPNKKGSFDGSLAVVSYVNCSGKCKANDDFKFMYANNDSALDYVAFYPGGILIKEGDGSGAFGKENFVPIYGDCAAGAKRDLADVNGDGNLDYVCVEQMRAKVWPGTENGYEFLIPRRTTFEFKSDWDSRASLSDINGDGKTDIVFSEVTWRKIGVGALTLNFDIGAIYVKYGKADCSFSDAVRFGLSAKSAYTLGLKPDFVVGNFNSKGVANLLMIGGWESQVVTSDLLKFQLNLFK